MNQSQIYLHECFALAVAGKGEAFGYKNFGNVADLIARMLRPYIIPAHFLSRPLIKWLMKSLQTEEGNNEANGN